MKKNEVIIIRINDKLKEKFKIKCGLEYTDMSHKIIELIYKYVKNDDKK